jgi:hypothetical protein
VNVERDEPLRGVLRLLGRIASVDRDQFELGAAERLDAAGRVDFVDGRLGAVFYQRALPRPGTRQRHDDGDFDVLLLRLNGDRRRTDCSEHNRARCDYGTSPVQ